MDDPDPDRAGESDAGSSPETSPDPGSPSDRRARNRDLLRRYVLEVLGEGKTEVVPEIFHEDVEMDARDGRTISGQAAAREYLEGVRDRFADLETEVDVLVADETTVMGKFRVTAVHEDDYFGVDATNREVTFRVMSLAVVEDGKMIEQGDMVNPLRMQPPSKRHGQFAVLDQIHDGVVVVDREGRVVEINPVARDLLEVGDREVLNEPIERLVDADVDLPAVGSSVELTFGDGRRIVEVSASDLSDLQDERVGRILVLRDVTERVRRRQQLELLSRQNERLDQYVSVLSHDLRNPLATASARVQLARRSGEERHFEEIFEAHDRMEAIIDDLRSSATGGLAMAETEPVSLLALAGKAWNTARTEGLTLETDVPDGFTVEADLNLLEHVLENLFRNAADHNDPPVTVTVGTLESSGDGRGFYVEDDGRGIPAERREDVLEHGFTTSEDGTGFGLAIVSEFVGAHGWEIDVVEGADGGARFEVTTDPVGGPS